MWMRRSLCVPVCVNCGMDCLTFRCFYPLGRRNVFFFTFLPEKQAVDGYEWKRTAESSRLDLSFWHLLRNLLSRLSQGPNISVSKAAESEGSRRR